MTLDIYSNLPRFGAHGTFADSGIDGLIPGENGGNGADGTDGDRVFGAVQDRTFTGDDGADSIQFIRSATGGSASSGGSGGAGASAGYTFDAGYGDDYTEYLFTYGDGGKAGLAGAAGAAGAAVVKYADLTFNLGSATDSSNYVYLAGSASGGNGGYGGNGGNGGESAGDFFGTVSTGGSLPYSNVFVTHGMAGMSGANGQNGSAGAEARVTFENMALAGDKVFLVIEGSASGGNGGGGGLGGNGGNGAADAATALGGGGIGADGGAGGAGGKALALVDHLSIAATGGLDLIVQLAAIGGTGGDGGSGGWGGKGATATLYSDPSTSSSLTHYNYAASGNGGNGGNGGAAVAAMRDSDITGSDSNDSVFIHLQATRNSAGSAGAGGHGVSSDYIVEDTDITIIDGTAAGDDGMNGRFGTALAEMRNVTIDLGGGDDYLNVILSVDNGGKRSILFTGNTFTGGAGLDQLYLGGTWSGDQSIKLNVNKGTLDIGLGKGNTFSGFEVFSGGNKADLFTDGKGDQTYFGKGGADKFDFGGHRGHDTIADFNTGEDVIRFRAFGPDLDSFADILGVATDTAGGVLIQTSVHSSVLLSNLSVADLQEANFVF
jgi:hypothetical protein